jgi:hypothetical protein
MERTLITRFQKLQDTNSVKTSAVPFVLKMVSSAHGTIDMITSRTGLAPYITTKNLRITV